tara:strand:- start:6433 stop:7143 length:711 start_codon:yes stop_codon:yes gene_type:complete
MKYSISGDNLQIANIELKKDESINAEAGALIYKSGNVTIDVESKGATKAVKRLLTGESLFLTKFSSIDGHGIVGVAGKLPGKIKPFQLKKGQVIIAQKGSYLASDMEVDMDLKVTKKIGAGLFGGEGFLLQKLSGPGTLLLHAAGDLIEYDLEKGQRLDIDTTHLVAFEETVDYDIRRVGSLKTTVFGAEGLFLAQMTGPGKVILQSMTKKILQPPAQQQGRKSGIVGGMLGGMHQ